MTVYGSQYVEGKVQELRHSSTSAILFWVPKLGGVDVKPSAAMMTVYSSGGSLLSSTSSAVSLCTLETEGWLGFSALSARYNIGCKASNASSGFTATIRDVQYTSATAGRLYLTDIYKTMASGGMVVVDDGDTPGSATAVEDPSDPGGTAYSAVTFGVINLASTGSYTIGENYYARIRWTYGTQTFYDQVYFDIVYAPLDVMTTSRMIDNAHPDWRQKRPVEWNGWTPAIHLGHAELCRRVRALGNRPAFIVKREELQPYEMAFIESSIVRDHLGMTAEEVASWAKRAESLWASRGEFAYSEAADDGVVDATPKVISHRWTR